MNRPLGTDRTDDDLLSLEEEAMPRRKMMVAMTKNLHRACLVGDPSPIVAKMYEKISNPKPGDLVVEITSHHEVEYRGFGILIERRVEETFISVDEGQYSETVWYVQYGPKKNDVVRWTNCMFIAALTEVERY